MNRRRALLTIAGLSVASVTRADQFPGARMPEGFDRPDQTGEVWGGIEMHGRRVQCPIPRALRQKNTDGSAPGPADGLCVIASQVCDGRWQHLVAKMAEMWSQAKTRPGGYSPPKLKRLVAEVAPELAYVSYEGSDTSWMLPLLSKRIPIGITWGTGRAYRYARIAHMVSLVGLWHDYAAIIDNNFPDFVAWVPRKEFDRRFSLGGYGWGFYWTPPDSPEDAEVPLPAVVLMAASLGGLASIAGVKIARDSLGVQI